MKVLVACEFSGVVRDAFRARGHDAWSCDLLPTEGDPTYHLVGDALDVLRLVSVDLLIAFPPCTYLCRAGARWWPGRETEQAEALAFVRALLSAPVPRVAVENPPGRIGTAIRPADQYIQPWEHGDAASKMTGLWLRNLPLLRPSNVVERGAVHVTKSGRRVPVWYNLPPGPERAKIRSRTFAGIAAAMAEQWGGLSRMKHAMNAETLLRDARARAKAARKTVGVVSHQTPRGGVLVSWDSLALRYDVGTPARSHATGRRSVVLPVLEQLLAPESLPQDMWSGLGDGS